MRFLRRRHSAPRLPALIFSMLLLSGLFCLWTGFLHSNSTARSVETTVRRGEGGNFPSTNAVDFLVGFQLRKMASVDFGVRYLASNSGRILSSDIALQLLDRMLLRRYDPFDEVANRDDSNNFFAFH